MEMSTENNFNDNTLLSMIFQNLHKMRESQEMCNVVLLCNDNISVHCHRLVLAGCSPYFHGMFKDEFKEQYEKEIKLEWINSQILSSIVNYIYTSNITITQETVQDLLAASDILQLTNLRSACVDFLERQFSLENCLGIEAIADLYSCNKLLSRAQKFIENNFTEISGNEEFLELPLNRLIKLLSNDHLNVATEEIIFESVLIWLKHDLPNREKCFLDLIQKIRIKLLRTEYLVQKFVEDSFLERQLHVNNCLFLNLFKFKYDKLTTDNNDLCFCEISTPRNSQVLLIIGGICNDALDNTDNTVELYDFDKKKWYSASPMLANRYNPGTLLLNGKLYVAGRDGEEAYDTVEEYNSQSNEWSFLPDMLEAREGCGFAGINNSLYAVGGYNNVWGEYLNTCEQFDLSIKKWSYLPPMLWEAGSVGSEIINNVLYIVGGRNGDGCLNSVQAFDLKTQKWSQLPNMTIKRVSAATCVLNGMLYVCGGQSYDNLHLNSVECYDPQTNSWLLVASMNMPRSDISAVIYKDLIYVIGGANGETEIHSSIEVYDPQQNVWSISPISLTCGGRWGHAAILMDKSNFKWLSKLQNK